MKSNPKNIIVSAVVLLLLSNLTLAQPARAGGLITLVAVGVIIMMLLYMPPGLAVADYGYYRRRHPILSRKLSATAVIAWCHSYLRHFRLSKFSVVSLTSHIHATFDRGISHIVRLITKKQMSGVDALGVIPAGTIMADEKPLRNRSVVEFPGESVCLNAALGDTEGAVPMMIQWASPEPASMRTTCIVGVTPEALEGRAVPGSNGVPEYKAHGLAPSQPPLTATARDDSRFLPAPAVAVSIGDAVKVKRTLYNIHADDLHERLFAEPGVLITSPGFVLSNYNTNEGGTRGKKLLLLIAILLSVLTPQAQLVRASGGISLGSAAAFGVLASSTITNTGFTVVNGDLGLHPGSSVVGFPPGVVNGAIHIADAVALQAKLDATVAYVAAAALPCGTNLTGQDLGGMTLTPGVYCFSSSAFLTGILTLDGPGQYIFQIGSTLITASSSSVNLINGADPCDIFWQVGSSATLGTFTNFAGNIIALASVGLNTNANNQGGLYALTAAVTLDDNDVTACDAGPEPTATTVPPTATQSPADTATNTPVNTATNTRVSTRTRTSTPVNTATNTPVNTAINTATTTLVPATGTPTNIATSTRTNTLVAATNTRTRTRTATGVPQATSTVTLTATKTKTPTITPTLTQTRRPTRTRTATKTKTKTKTATPGYVTKTPTPGVITRTPTKTRTPVSQATATKTCPPAMLTRTATPNCISIDGQGNPSWDCTPTPARTSTPGGCPPTPVTSPTPGGCAVLYQSQNVPVYVCDECTVYSNLTVSNGPSIASIEVVGLQIAHEYAADLDVFLISPAGTRVELFTDKCGGQEWTQGNTGFTLAQNASQGIGASCPPAQGVYRPEGSLSALQGQSRTGVWRLEITDDGPVDVGTLYGWGLRIWGGCEGDAPAVVGVPAPSATSPGRQYAEAIAWAYTYVCAFTAACAYIYMAVG